MKKRNKNTPYISPFQMPDILYPLITEAYDLFPPLNLPSLTVCKPCCISFEEE